MTQPWDNKSLSADVRRSLKDNYRIVEDAAALLKKVTGVAWTFEADYAEFEKHLTENNKKHLAVSVYRRFRDVAKVITYESGIIQVFPYKEAVLERIHKHKIVAEVLVTNAEFSSKVTSRIQGKSLVIMYILIIRILDGVLYLVIRKEIIAQEDVDSSMAGHDLRITLENDELYPNTVSLAGQHSLKCSFEGKDRYQRAVENLKSAVGEGWEFDADYLAWDKSLPLKDRRNLHNIYEYFLSLATVMETFCKDEFLKESLLDKVHKKKIFIEANPKPDNTSGPDAVLIKGIMQFKLRRSNEYRWCIAPYSSYSNAKWFQQTQ